MKKIWVIVGSLLIFFLLLFITRTECGYSSHGLSGGSDCDCKCIGLSLPGTMGSDLESSHYNKYCYGYNTKKYRCSFLDKFHGDMTNDIYVSNQLRYLKNENLLILSYFTNTSRIEDKDYMINISCVSSSNSAPLEFVATEKIFNGKGPQSISFEVLQPLVNKYLCDINITDGSIQIYNTESYLND